MPDNKVRSINLHLLAIEIAAMLLRFAPQSTQFVPKTTRFGLLLTLE